MAHQDSVRILASLLRATNEARPIILLGAGASFSSGVPLAAESVRRIARRVFAEKVKGGAVLPEQVKLTEWQTWLQSQPWFVKGEDRLPENFPLAVEHLLQPREYRARLLRDLFQPVNGIGAGYKNLAGLVLKGLIRTILTCNFDTALPIALNERRPHVPHIAEVNRNSDDLREFNIFNRAQIIWLHGKAEQYSDRNLAGEIEKLERKLIDLLVPTLTDSPLIVIGYRGAEPSIMESLLGKNTRRTQNFKNGIYWCALEGEPVHPNVETLRRTVGSNFRLLEILGFDELMEELSRELAGEDLYPSARGIEQAQGTLAFDDRAVTTANCDDLDHDLMLAVMREYCVKLGRAAVTRDTLPGLLREQGLLVTIEGVEYPTAGCILLFSKNPQKHFPHAVVSATIAGKKRTIFSGNLISQRVALLDWLDGEDINPKLKIKRRATHDTTTAYPRRALVELLVNLLVHRDYECSDTASINVQPGRSATFRNPGGLSELVAQRVMPDDAGRFRPVPNVSDLRNRALCDVFFAIQAMEREGTGLSDVEELARERGGDSAFTHDARNGMFIAQLLQPVPSVGSKNIARDDRSTEGYIFNTLPFASMPSTISIVRLKVPLKSRPDDVPLDEVGTFIHHEEELWSFVPLPILIGLLGPIADTAASRDPGLNEIEADLERRKIVSWLLRKHFERYLSRFEAQGLILEESRKKGRRAYFMGRDGKPRKLIYDTPRRKAVLREVGKQRAEGARTWFENEGFGYEVTQLDGVWAVRIKPFYMFTGRDAKKPLPAFARASRATRRVKLDRNKNVEDDLTFWGRFLSEGRSTINIGQDHVDDLILEGQFLTIEVAEHGLLRDSDEGQDRMPA
jgi:hypothetical protein